MSSPYVVAAIRAVLGGLVMAGAAFFGQLASGGNERASLIAAGVAFFGYLALRFGVEGTIDHLAATPSA